MRFTPRAAALMVALAALPAVTSTTFAESRNWAREHVRRWEAAAFERATGIDPQTLPNRGPSEIVGGRQAAPGRWPFQVGLLLASVDDNFNAQFCGGSIVDEEFIVTAAHCTDFLTFRKLEILTGTQSLARGGKRRAVKAIRIHPKWDNRTFDYDIAIVQLEQKIPDLKRNDKVTLLTRADEDRLAPKGTKTFVTGWGDMDNGEGFPTELREVSVPIVGRGVCNAPASYDGFVTTRMVCAGYAQGGKDSCQGDSGGPLLVRNENGRFIMQAGITSWGEGCALPKFYGVYSRVAALEAWATSMMHALGRADQSAAACASSGSPSPACQRAAKTEADREIAVFLDTIKRRGTPAQTQGALAAQRAWSQALGGLCAFEAAAGMQSRDACVAKETRKRADDLAGQLSELN